MFQTLTEKWLRFRAKWSLIHRYRYLNEVDRLMEEYQTAKLLDGGSQEFLNKGREQLTETQGRIREQQKLIDFLKEL